MAAEVAGCAQSSRKRPIVSPDSIVVPWRSSPSPWRGAFACPSWRPWHGYRGWRGAPQRGRRPSPDRRGIALLYSPSPGFLTPRPFTNAQGGYVVLFPQLALLVPSFIRSLAPAAGAAVRPSAFRIFLPIAPNSTRHTSPAQSRIDPLSGHREVPICVYRKESLAPRSGVFMLSRTSLAPKSSHPAAPTSGRYLLSKLAPFDDHRPPSPSSKIEVPVAEQVPSPHSTSSPIDRRDRLDLAGGAIHEFLPDIRSRTLP